MTAEIPFKVYCQDEIRRFSLPDRVCSDAQGYACLVQRIQSVFGIPPEQPLRLRWLDLEGDRIAFSSSAELVDAVDQLSNTAAPGAAVRVYVSILGSDGQRPFDQSEIFHPGVYCDGCNSGIRGYRFKCLVCPDYDLCRDCLWRDIHNQHQMKLIRRPGDASWGGWGCGWQHPGMTRRCVPRQQQQQQRSQGAVFVTESSASGGTQMRDASAMATVGEIATSGARTPPIESSAANVRAEQQLLVEHVTSAINTALQPLGIDASIQVMRQEADSGVQTTFGRAQSSEAAIQATAVAACSANSAAGTRGPVMTQSNFCTTPQPYPLPPPPTTDSAAVFNSQPLETSSARFTGVGGGSDGGFELVAAPPDPKIARSLEHMIAMGFNDEGGWLTRLLAAKDGDICAVLDAIRPVGGGK